MTRTSLPTTWQPYPANAMVWGAGDVDVDDHEGAPAATALLLGGLGLSAVGLAAWGVGYQDFIAGAEQIFLNVLVGLAGAMPAYRRTAGWR